MAIDAMVTAKGRAEIHTLIASDLVGSWGEAHRTLKKVLSMLLPSRPDLVRNYFFPDVWRQITQLEKKAAARVILSAMMAAVVAEAGAPAVEEWDQALFYWETGVPAYMEMAEAWATAHPTQCRRPLTRDRRPPQLPFPPA